VNALSHPLSFLYLPSCLRCSYFFPLTLITHPALLIFRLLFAFFTIPPKSITQPRTLVFSLLWSCHSSPSGNFSHHHLPFAILHGTPSTLCIIRQDPSHLSRDNSTFSQGGNLP
jgi:hypothetical protein